MVRVGERHRLRFDYFTLDRTGQTTITTPIVFRDVVLQAGDPAQTTMSLRSLGISYEHPYSYICDALCSCRDLRDQRHGIFARARVGHRNPARQSSWKIKPGRSPPSAWTPTYVVSKRFYFDARLQYFEIGESITSTARSSFCTSWAALYRFSPQRGLCAGLHRGQSGHRPLRQMTSGDFFDPGVPRVRNSSSESPSITGRRCFRRRTRRGCWKGRPRDSTRPPAIRRARGTACSDGPSLRSRWRP